MFVYCNNNPISFIDPSGFCTCIGTRLSFIDCNNKDCPESSANVMNQWRSKGVEYISNGTGKGGKIKNSYLITDSIDMYEYADFLVNKSAYRDDFTGSVEGVVYEWDIHNILYYVGPEEWKDNAMDVDFGRTIFCDNHGKLSQLMWFGYRLTYPEEFLSDLYC